MALIAIDVAILPPPDVTAIAMALSADLPAAESEGLHLDDSHLPHVTLTQQFVDVNELPRVTAAVASALMTSAALSLRVTGAGRGTRSVWMQIERSPALHGLHRTLMDALAAYERARGTAAAFAGRDARPGDVQWVSRFRTTSSFDRFTPHITLGHASQMPRIDPLSFEADTIALCHLGRFCTCREVLASWRLPIRR